MPEQDPIGEVTSYKKLYMQFEDSEGLKKNIIINDPKNMEEGDYADLVTQDAAIEAVMDTIIAKNIFHNKGNDFVKKVNGRIVTYTSTNVMNVGPVE